MIIAGEASGDELGAEFVRGIREIAPQIQLFGTPGPRMRNEGVEPVFKSDEWSVVGVAAVAKAIPDFLKIKRQLLKIADERKPEAVVLIDFPEFNLKLAKALKVRGHRVIYYVSPQIWAWRQYRYKTIRDDVDLLLSILPFEKEWYLKKEVEHVEFVGNPISRRTDPTMDRKSFCEQYQLDKNSEIIALLPGSRKKEIVRHLPTLLEAAVLVSGLRSSVQSLIAAPNEKIQKISEPIIREYKRRTKEKIEFKLITDDTINALNAADAAAVSSGTATLEAGLVGTPMTVIYKIPAFDAMLFKPFVDVPHFALINLVAGRQIVSELVQKNFTAEKVSAELIRLLDRSTNAEIRRELAEATRELRENVSKPAAEVVVDFLKGRSTNDLES